MCVCVCVYVATVMTVQISLCLVVEPCTCGFNVEISSCKRCRGPCGGTEIAAEKRMRGKAEKSEK